MSLSRAIAFCPVVAGVVLDLLQQAEIGLVGGVVGQHVEDEPLLDRLPHGVEAERLELAVGSLDAESSSVLGLGVAVKANSADVRQPTPLLHLGDDPVLRVVLVADGVGPPRLHPGTDTASTS